MPWSQKNRFFFLKDPSFSKCRRQRLHLVLCGHFNMINMWNVPPRFSEFCHCKFSWNKLPYNFGHFVGEASKSEFKKLIILWWSVCSIPTVKMSLCDILWLKRVGIHHRALCLFLWEPLRPRWGLVSKSYFGVKRNLLSVTPDSYHSKTQTEVSPEINHLANLSSSSSGATQQLSTAGNFEISKRRRKFLFSGFKAALDRFYARVKFSRRVASVPMSWEFKDAFRPKSVIRRHAVWRLCAAVGVSFI